MTGAVLDREPRRSSRRAFEAVGEACKTSRAGRRRRARGAAVRRQRSACQFKRHADQL